MILLARSSFTLWRCAVLLRHHVPLWLLSFFLIIPMLPLGVALVTLAYFPLYMSPKTSPLPQLVLISHAFVFSTWVQCLIRASTAISYRLILGAGDLAPCHFPTKMTIPYKSEDEKGRVVGIRHHWFHSFPFQQVRLLHAHGARSDRCVFAAVLPQNQHQPSEPPKCL